MSEIGEGKKRVGRVAAKPQLIVTEPGDTELRASYLASHLSLAFGPGHVHMLLHGAQQVARLAQEAGDRMSSGSSVKPTFLG